MNVPLKRYWGLLINHIKPQKGRFSLLTVLLLGSIGLQVVNPQIMRYFIDSAIADQATERLAVTALVFIAIALLQQVGAVSATYVFSLNHLGYTSDGMCAQPRSHSGCCAITRIGGTLDYKPSLSVETAAYLTRRMILI